MQPVIKICALVMLAACVPTADPETGTCGPGSYAGLVGTNIAAVTLPADADIRVIRPGDAVTMDFIATRTNIELDATGTIARVYCG